LDGAHGAPPLAARLNDREAMMKSRLFFRFFMRRRKRDKAKWRDTFLFQKRGGLRGITREKRPQKEEKNVARKMKHRAGIDRSMMHSFLFFSFHYTRAAVNLSPTIVYLCLEHRRRLAHLCLCLCLRIAGCSPPLVSSRFDSAIPPGRNCLRPARLRGYRNR